MRVFIAEKPSLAKAIAHVLPGHPVTKGGFIEVGDDIVTWCFGHLMRLADAAEYDQKFKLWSFRDLPILPEEFMVLPNDTDSSYLKQIKIIEKLVRNCDEVVHAGDADREGHLLVQWVLNHIGCRKPVMRLWLSANDPVSVKKALSSMRPNSEYRSLFDSGECRSFADWMVGINLSRAYTLAFKNNGADQMVSVGRVQSPTLALIVERDRTIEGFKPRDYFIPWIVLEHENQRFRARWLPGDHPDLNSDGQLASMTAAAEILADCETAEVVAARVEQKKEQAPLPYRLATLQAACSSRFGMTAEHALEVVQSLYEKHKLVSYPRSDCNYLPESQHDEAPEILKAISFRYSEVKALVHGADPSIKSRAFNDKKVTAHHGIIPTRGHQTTAADLTEDEVSVYDLIVRAYLAQFYPPHEYEATRIDFRSGDEVFRATGRVPTRAGWRDVMSSDVDEDDGKHQDEEVQHLPRLDAGNVLEVADKTVEKKTTKPPAYYTDGSLLLDMENIHRVVQRRARLEGPDAVARTAKIVAQLKEVAGIGTDATRARILKILVERKYIIRKGKSLRSTPLGREVTDALPNRVKSPEMTALFEQALDEIRLGTMSRGQFLSVQRDWVGKACLEAKEKKLAVTPYKKAESGKGVSAPKQASKPKVSAGEKSAGKESKKAPSHLKPKAGMDCPACRIGKMVIRGQTGKEFLGCNRFPDCKKGILLDKEVA